MAEPGTWPLAPRLAAIAAGREAGPDLGQFEPPGPLPLRRLIVQHGVSRLAAALDPVPVRMTGTVVAPAAGVSGPAAHGPINAVRVAESVSFTSAGIPVSLQVLQAQQDRCWLLCADCQTAARTSAGCTAGDSVLLLPDEAATDTARAIEYLYDAGLGQDWPGVALLGAPRPCGDGMTRIVCIFTEGPYLCDIAAGLAAASGASRPPMIPGPAQQAGCRDGIG